jgi:hypothetical protein
MLTAWNGSPAENLWLRLFEQEQQRQLKFTVADIVRSIQQRSQRMESENVNRDEVIQSRIRELEAELAQRRRYGADTYENGDVLYWEKTFSTSDGVYRYAAVKTDDRWYVTGAGGGSKTGITWDRLVTDYWTTANVVDEVHVADTWKVVGAGEDTEK